MAALAPLFLVVPSLRAAEPSKPFRSDPVDQLIQALKQDRYVGRSKEGQKYREETLAKLEKQLITVSDLSRALLLKDLKDNSPDPGPGGELESERELRRIDLNFRKSVAKRFVEAVRKVFADPKAERGAAAALIGEMAVFARENNIRSREVQLTLVRLVPDLVDLTRSDTDANLRELAIRSLGKISGAVTNEKGEPVKDRFAVDLSVPALIEFLPPRKVALPLRKAAAAALGELVQNLPESYKNARGQSPIGPPLSSDEYLKICRLVFGAAGRGLADPDAAVRALCVTAIKEAGEAVSDYIPLPARREDFPAEGRKPTEDEIAEIKRLRARVDLDRAELQPVLTAFKDVAPGLARILKSTESSDDLRFAATRALEEMGYARLRLLNREASVPVLEPPKKEEEIKKPVGKAVRQGPIQLATAQQPPAKLTPDPLLEGLRAALPTLANRSAFDPDHRVRTRAIETMESMGDEASPAWEFLRYALRPGESRFVQWAAARALGRMSPAKAHAEEVAPYLAGLLLDPDMDVRLNVGRTLESFGPAAGYKDVVNALARAAGTEADTSPWPPAHGIVKPAAPGTGDAEARIAAIKALAAIGTAAEPAVPNLAKVLTDSSEVRVRRAAAEALGRFGPLAKKAEQALRQALHDEDPEVRRLAGNALLNLKSK
jgi:HEAT repeat protein